MGNDQADDFEKAILLSFAQDGQVEESLKVINSATIVPPSMRGRFLVEGLIFSETGESKDAICHSMESQMLVFTKLCVSRDEPLPTVRKSRSLLAAWSCA